VLVQVLSAEGDKRSEELKSEGVKIRKENESLGELIKIRNEAQAYKERAILEVYCVANHATSHNAYSVLTKDLPFGWLFRPQGRQRPP
jgi:hypothetical protein